MRVIAGVARGRRLASPVGQTTRPTSDRVKEAWFSALAPRLVGASVADLYAGSGGLGIEALSRGAAHATFVETDHGALAVIRDNLATTGLGDAADVIGRDVAMVLSGQPPGVPWDVVLADPPYDVDDGQLTAILTALVGHLADDAIVCLERSARSADPPWPPELRPDRVRKYGDTVLHAAVVVRPATTGAPPATP